jgi:hypothetical protein
VSLEVVSYLLIPQTAAHSLHCPFDGRSDCKGGNCTFEAAFAWQLLTILSTVQAYMQGQNDPEYKEIVKAVSAIIFLSTPHRGTGLAETLNRILQVSFVANPMQFIAELASGSQTLQKLNEEFRHVAPKLRIASFYETRPTTMFKKAQVVSQCSTSIEICQVSNMSSTDGPRERLISAGLPWRDLEAIGCGSSWSV